MTRDPVLRSSADADLPAITSIYAHHVLTGLASFELTAPDEHEMGRRRSEVLRRKLPHLVAEIGGTVVGYAYASVYRPRIAYRFTVEDSVYLHPDYLRKGLGRLLLSAVIDVCERLGYRQMIAVIGDSSNSPSIGLHAACGFHQAGILRSVGFKHGRWVDTVLMQRPLGASDTMRPREISGASGNP